MDYTDGRGWARLDKTAAVLLGQIAASFPRIKTEKCITMLLILYASMDNSGVITMGRRTLAKLAGVGENTARYFLNKLLKDGAIVQIEQEDKNKTRYMFWWIAERRGGLITTRKSPGGG